MPSGCAVFGCDHKQTPMYRFPHPLKDYWKRFGKWLALVGRQDLISMDPIKVYENRRVCSRHFSSTLYGHNGRSLKKNVLPDLHLPGQVWEESDLDGPVDSTPEGGCVTGFGEESLLSSTAIQSVPEACVLEGPVHSTPASVCVTGFGEESLLSSTATQSVDPEEAASMSPRSAEKHDHSNHELLPENEEIVSTVPQPTTTNYIRKHIADPCHMVEELPEVYTFVTLPHLEQFHLNLQWVYKILSHEEGQERIIYESPSKDDKDGFLLIKDPGWDGVNLDNLHLLAIAYRPGILSLRDLRQHHLSLLKNMYVMGKEVIMEKYDIVGSQLHIFIQYQPSFYHLHVHFTTLKDGICELHCGKAHLLHSVINNIQACPTYYEISPLTFRLKESDDLFEKFEAHGLVKRIGSS